MAAPQGSPALQRKRKRETPFDIEVFIDEYRSLKSFKTMSDSEASVDPHPQTTPGTRMPNGASNTSTAQAPPVGYIPNPLYTARPPPAHPSRAVGYQQSPQYAPHPVPYTPGAAGHQQCPQYTPPVPYRPQTAFDPQSLQYAPQTADLTPARSRHIAPSDYIVRPYSMPGYGGQSMAQQMSDRRSSEGYAGGSSMYAQGPRHPRHPQIPSGHGGYGQQTFNQYGSNHLPSYIRPGHPQQATRTTFRRQLSQETWQTDSSLTRGEGDSSWPSIPEDPNELAPFDDLMNGGFGSGFQPHNPNRTVDPSRTFVPNGYGPPGYGPTNRPSYPASMGNDSGQPPMPKANGSGSRRIHPSRGARNGRIGATNRPPPAGNGRNHPGHPSSPNGYNGTSRRNDISRGEGDGSASHGSYPAAPAPSTNPRFSGLVTASAGTHRYATHWREGSLNNQRIPTFNDNVPAGTIGGQPLASYSSLSRPQVGSPSVPYVIPDDEDDEDDETGLVAPASRRGQPTIGSQAPASTATNSTSNPSASQSSTASAGAGEERRYTTRELEEMTLDELTQAFLHRSGADIATDESLLHGFMFQRLQGPGFSMEELARKSGKSANTLSKRKQKHDRAQREIRAREQR